MVGDLEACLTSIQRLADRLEGHFPRPNPADPNGRYLKSSPGDKWQWTDAFWVGQLRLAHQITGHGDFKLQADALMPALWSILAGQPTPVAPKGWPPPYFRAKPFSHDLGFFGLLAGDDEYARSCADAMLTLYDGRRGFIQSWPERPDCLIIDSAMTTQLLWRVSEHPEDKYAEAATQHWLKLHNLVRDDGSTIHVGWLDADGRWVKGTTHQGLNDRSCWSRGQAWAIHGGLSYDRTLGYWQANTVIPAPPYDFHADNQAPQDTSAAAIYADATGDLATLAGLEDQWSVASNTQADGLLTGGCIGLTGPITRGQLPYGDYYYLHALARKEGFA